MNVCVWHKPDISRLSSNVRYSGESGHWATVTNPRFMSTGISLFFKSPEMFAFRNLPTTTSGPPLSRNHQRPRRRARLRRERRCVWVHRLPTTFAQHHPRRSAQEFWGYPPVALPNRRGRAASEHHANVSARANKQQTNAVTNVGDACDVIEK
jgi:hypothetical protein